MRTHLVPTSSNPSSPLESFSDIICKGSCFFLPSFLFSVDNFSMTSTCTPRPQKSPSLVPRDFHTARHSLFSHLTSSLGKIQKWIISLEVCSLPSPAEDPLILWAVSSRILSGPVPSSILESWPSLLLHAGVCFVFTLSLTLYFSQLHLNQSLQMHASDLNLHF